ncbi:transposase [Reyranella sp. MMS21-HV4-11]|uniref:Transposase n=1 Tax=Reyranella humidisoli TaxID=2849149 RepID=A0ABS6II81_9HYPH|nr:transposase [Reyranella sp. MMS21-HV4-11]
MKRKRFSEEQIIEILKLHNAGAKHADLCRQHGISEATLYHWRSRYGGMQVSDAKRLRRLEEAKPLAEEAAGRSDARQCGTEGYRLGEVLRPAVRRRAVDHVQRFHGVSQRRAYGLIGMDVSS